MKTRPAFFARLPVPHPNFIHGHFLNLTDVAQKGHGEGRFAHPGPCGNGAQLPCAQSAGKVVKLLEARGNGFALFVGGKRQELVQFHDGEVGF